MGMIIPAGEKELISNFSESSGHDEALTMLPCFFQIIRQFRHTAIKMAKLVEDLELSKNIEFSFRPRESYIYSSVVSEEESWLYGACCTKDNDIRLTSLVRIDCVNRNVFESEIDTVSKKTVADQPLLRFVRCDYCYLTIWILPPNAQS